MRILLISAGFCAVGAVQGAVAGILSLTPIWVDGLVSPPPFLQFDAWTLMAIVVIAAPLGAICSPIVGWILLKRAPLWRIVTEPTAGAILGSWAAWLYMYFVPGMGGTPQLVIGAAFGAGVATVRLRLLRADYLTLKQAT